MVEPPHTTAADRWVTLLAPSIAAGIFAFIVAYAGHSIQKKTAEATLSREYVEIALPILRDKDADAELKEWALDTINANAPTKLPPSLREKLKKGTAVFPPHRRICEGMSTTTVCRPSMSDCDTPEFCNGVDPYCPPDRGCPSP